MWGRSCTCCLVSDTYLQLDHPTHLAVGAFERGVALYLAALSTPCCVCCPLREPTWESIANRTFQPGGAQTLTAVFDQPGFEAGAAAAVAGGSQPTGSRWQVRYMAQDEVGFKSGPLDSVQPGLHDFYHVGR